MFNNLFSNLKKLVVPLLIIEVIVLLPLEIILFQRNSNSSFDITISTLAIIIGALNFVFLFDTVYNLTIAICGLNPHSKPKDSRNNFVLNKPFKYNNFALIICAHNEMYVIANTLEQMVKLNYPKSHLRIIVMCDNCTDKTVELASKIAQKYPDLISVIERHDTINRGKPFAVRFAIDWVNLNYSEFEAISVADADNIYHKDFFGIMNEKLNDGSNIIQGYLGVKNPYDSFISTGSTLSYYASSLVYFASRQNLGMSSTIGGTGFVVSRDILEKIGWDMGSLTEDLEFATKAILLGNRVEYAYDAITYDEKPNTLIASYNQRKRWMQGHHGLAVEYIPKLLLALLSCRNSNWLSLFDYIIYLLRPIKKVLYGYVLAILIIMQVFGILIGTNINLFPKNATLTIGLMLISMTLEYSCAILEGFRWYKLPAIIYYYTIFNINDYLATFAGIFLASPKGVWVKTEHKITTSVENVMSN